MNRRHALQAGFAGIALSAFPVRAYAHRKKKAFSIIEWNADQKLLEITHTLHLHDAEQGLNQLGKIAKPDLSSLRARAQLALYVHEHFSLKLGNNEPIPLEILGAEIENSYAYVYQQVALTSRPENLIAKNTLL
ncbi:MAG: hypothetical protein JKX72_08375, partial [Robiginitomaculum sp.]|nr:hypothetical protein [Robiginitomaculum sp.]